MPFHAIIAGHERLFARRLVWLPGIARKSVQFGARLASTDGTALDALAHRRLIHFALGV
jgi:hypothetical protein